MSWNEEFSLEIKISVEGKLTDEVRLALVHEAESMEEVKKIMNQKPPTKKAIIKDFRNSNDHAEMALKVDGSNAESISWSDSNTALGKFSKKYPNVLFIMTCKDREENSGSEYRIYASDGRIASVDSIIKVTYPTFYEDRFIAGETDFIIHDNKE